MVQVASTRVGAAMAALALAVVLWPQLVISAVAPGLSASTSAESAGMLRVMAPAILLAGRRL